MELRPLTRSEPELPAEVRRRLGRVRTLRLGAVTVAWPTIDGKPQLVVDDGTRAIATGLAAQQVSVASDGVLAASYDGTLAKLGFDGAVRWYQAMTPAIVYASELGDGRILCELE